jgi:hypothetical protein
MTNKFYVELCVYDYEVSHGEITETLGLSPDRVETKGAKKNVGPGLDTAIEQNGWILESQVDGKEPLEDHIQRMLDRTKDQAPIFKSLSEKNVVQLSIVAYYDYPNFGLEVNNKQLERLAKMGVVVDFDLYYLGDDKQ